MPGTVSLYVARLLSRLALEILFFGTAIFYTSTFMGPFYTISNNTGYYIAFSILCQEFFVKFLLFTQKLGFIPDVRLRFRL